MNKYLILNFTIPTILNINIRKIIKIYILNITHIPMSYNYYFSYIYTKC